MDKIKAYKSVIYLVPNLFKNERINIGIILYSDELFKMAIEKEKVSLSKLLNPILDMEMVNDSIKDLNYRAMRIFHQDKLNELPKVNNSILRFTEFEGLITYDLDKELKTLMKQYVQLEK